VTGRDLLGHPRLRPILAGPALLYGAAVSVRNALYDAGRLRAHRLPCTVISLGNLTVGGTGKTPLTSFIAGMLRESGYRVGVASRGYRRLGARGSLLVSDGRSILAEPRVAGDEPYLIARDNPSILVGVGADRVAVARLLLAAGAPEVIVLDDAFQHRRIARDLDLLLVDGRDPWGNGKMLPCGPLREPLSAIARADALVLTRSEGRTPPSLSLALERYNRDAALIHCRLDPGSFVRSDGESIGTASLKGFSAYAFSGIARPDHFEEDLRKLGIRLVGTRRFPDHHRYSRGDLDDLATVARTKAAEALLTTEKDLVRIEREPQGAPPLFALTLRVGFPHGSNLQAWLLDRLATLRPAGINAS
jgi:tetraacyldisaccharide 4'-kinase